MEFATMRTCRSRLNCASVRRKLQPLTSGSKIVWPFEKKLLCFYVSSHFKEENSSRSQPRLQRSQSAFDYRRSCHSACHWPVAAPRRRVSNVQRRLHSRKSLPVFGPGTGAQKCDTHPHLHPLQWARPTASHYRFGGLWMHQHFVGRGHDCAIRPERNHGDNG